MLLSDLSKKCYNDRKNILGSRYAFFVRNFVFDTKKPTETLEEQKVVKL